MDEKLVSIEKFNGSENWSTWKFQIKHLLLSEELFGYVDGSEQKPAETASAEDKAKYKLTCNSVKALSTIVLSINPSQLYLITDCEEPQDAWDKLKRNFERSTLANKLYLKKQYFCSVMEDGASVESHLRYMKGITDQLAAMGSAIAEEDQVVALLGSLPPSPSYATLVTSIESRGDENLKLDDVQESIRHEEQKLKQAAQFSSVDDTSALLCNRGSSKRGRNKSKVCRHVISVDKRVTSVLTVLVNLLLMIVIRLNLLKLNPLIMIAHRMRHSSLTLRVNQHLIPVDTMMLTDG